MRQIEAVISLLHRRPDGLVAFAIEAFVAAEIAIAGASADIKLVHVVDIQPGISDQIILPQNVRVLLDVIDREKVESEISTVIEQGALFSRNIRIDAQARVLLNLLKLPLKSLDAGLRQRELPPQHPRH